MASLQSRVSKRESRRRGYEVRRFYIAWCDPDGTQRKRVVLASNGQPTTSREHAEAALRRKQREIDGGLTGTRMAPLVAKYLAARCERIESRGTRHSLRQNLGYVRDGLGDSIEGWTRAGFVQYLVKGVRDKGWKRSTCSRRTSALNGFVIWARANHELPLERDMARDVLKEVDAIAPFERTKGRKMRVPTWDEVCQFGTYLVASLDDEPKAGLALALALFVGLRREEVLQLRWDSITLTAMQPDITLVGKTCERTVLIREPLLTILHQVPETERTGFVCPYLNRQKPNNNNTALRWLQRRALGKSDTSWKPYTWHCFRRAFCSWLWCLKLQPNQIMDEMGHSSLTTTSRYSRSIWPEQRLPHFDFTTVSGGCSTSLTGSEVHTGT